jgi:hypothetical protein
MRDWKDLPKYKGSDVGFFLGCGSSINDITPDQWDIITSNDVWVSNNFLYHPLVPDFYHLELKSGKQEWLDVWKKRYKKKTDYDPVKFIVNRDHCDHLLYALSGEPPWIFGYPRKVVRTNNKCDLVENYATHSNNASFTLIMDLMYKMGYKKIIIFGVDLKHSMYFWTGKRRFGKVHAQTNANRPKKAPHLTSSRVLRYLKSFNKRWMKGQCYVGYKDTLLFEDRVLKYIDIEEEF